MHPFLLHQLADLRHDELRRALGGRPLPAFPRARPPARARRRHRVGPAGAPRRVVRGLGWLLVDVGLRLALRRAAADEPGYARIRG